jgi:16S rRNA (cytidine1402-2'-O)-methyltransferase
MAEEKTGVLYVVATPIGNLEDITLRALRILGEVDYILCEDTRVTGKLLAHYDIKTSRRRYDAHTSKHTHTQIIDDIKNGQSVALVSDAGTPGVSDPGVLLVQLVRASEARIEAIPGPSAVTTAVSIAGLVGNQFTFLGFVPQKKGRETFFRDLVSYQHPVMFFESTHRILKTLQSLQNLSVNRKVLLGRELTKLHEEMLIGTAEELLTIMTENPVKQKGEFVVILAPTT